MKQSNCKAPSNLSDLIHRQLNMYALAAGAAGVGLLAWAQPAEAKIVYTKANKHLPPNYQLDLNHDKVNDFNFFRGSRSGSSWLLVRASNSSNLIWGNGSGSGGSASALKAHVKVGPNGHFQPSNDVMVVHDGWGNYRGQWHDVSNRYLGLLFHVKGKVHYGWARLSVSGPSNATLTGYAYETVANKPIITGKTKGPDVITVQPGSLGHLAAGASAIPAWRGTGSVTASH